jgi:hypothetical protein
MEHEARKIRKEDLAGELPVVANLQDEEDFWRLMNLRPRLSDYRNLVLELRNWFRYKPAQLDGSQ